MSSHEFIQWLVLGIVFIGIIYGEIMLVRKAIIDGEIKGWLAIVLYVCKDMSISGVIFASVFLPKWMFGSHVILLTAVIIISIFALISYSFGKALHFLKQRNITANQGVTQ